MQIVIDIPEETANEIKDNVMFAGAISSEILCDVTSAIVNGIPLDKIRAEITAIAINGQVDERTMFIRTGEQVKQMALDIIDKYQKARI